MIVFFKSYVMNFADFVLNCYSHITSHVSQAFTSFTHYISYSLLNIVYVTVYVFGLTHQVCKYFEFFYAKIDLMLKNLWRMFENLNFGKIGFKTCAFEKLYISYSCILFIFFNAWRSFYTKLGCFSKPCLFFIYFILFYFIFFRISIDRGCFSINRNCFKNSKGAFVYFNQSKNVN